MSDTGSVGVGFFADPASEERLTHAIESAVAGGFEKGMERLSQVFTRNANFSRTLKDLQDKVAKTFDPRQFAKLTEGLTNADKSVARLAKSFKDLGLATSTANKAVEQQTVRLAKESIRAREQELAAERQRLRILSGLESRRTSEAIANLNRQLVADKAAATERLQNQRAVLDSIGRAERQAAQESVIATRVAGQQRIAILRGVIDQIQRLERGVGTVISGTVRGAGAALGAGGRGIASLFRREASEVAATNTILERELRQRESVFRSSFRRQETLLRETITRQQRSVERLRTIGSTGLTGAVTGRGVGSGIGLALGAIGGVGVASRIAQGFRDSTNLTEQLNKNRVVFGQFADEIIRFSSTSVSALGTTQAAALEATGTFGNLFRAVGLTEQQATFMSVALTGLATDLASFNNATPEEAFIALRAGLVGEQEPLRRFGVNLNDATLKAKALELGLYSGKGALDASAKAQAAFALILEQTTLAQGDFARTADVGANAQRRAKAAVDEFFSSLAGLLKGPITGLANLAVPTFQTLTNLVSGKNLSDGLAVVRDGLKGLGVGLGAVLAAKGAVEVIRLLGTVASFALTPFGALVTVVGGAAAALGFLLPRSEAVREALSTGLGFVTDTVLPKLQQGFENVVEFFTDTVAPAAVKLGQAVGKTLVAGFERTVEFTKTTVIPALSSFARFLVTTAVPAVVAFGQQVAEWVGVGLEKIGEFWTVVRPILQPAIEGFQQLGSAIADAFRGDFGDLLSGFGAAGAGIGRVALRLGQIVLDALKPLGSKLLDFLAGVFSGDNLKRLAGGVLDLVEFIGFTIGDNADIIIEALAAIVAGAGVVAFRFAKGFVEGLMNSLPNLLGDVVDLIRDNFTTALFGVAALGLILGPIRNLFTRAGTEAGTSFAASFTAATKNQVGFLQGLLGNPASIRGGGSAVLGGLSALPGLQVQTRALGGTTAGLASVQAVRDQLAALKTGLSDAQIAGLMFRDQFNTLFRGNNGILGNFKNLVADMRAVAKAGGPTIGQQLAAGIKSGLTAAAVGGLAFLGGRAEGRAGGSGAVSAITSGLVGLSVGGPIVGAAAAGLSLIGTEMGKAQQKAEETAKKVRELADAIRVDLPEAVQAGTRVSLASSLSRASSGQVAETILGQLDDKTIKTLTEAGITFTDVLVAFQNGPAAVEELVRSFANLEGEFNQNTAAAFRLITMYDILEKSIDAVNEKNRFLKGPAAGNIPTIPTTTFQALANQAAIAGNIPTIPTTTFQALNPPKVDVSNVTSALGDIEGALGRVNTKLGEYQTKIAEAFGVQQPLETQTAQAVLDVESIVTQLSQLDLTSVADRARETLLKSQLAESLAGLVSTGISEGAISGAEDAGALLGPALQGAMDTITALELPDDVKETLRQSIVGVFESGFQSDAIDEAAEAGATSAGLAILGVFDGLKEEAMARGADTGQGLADGLRSKVNEVATAAGYLAHQAEIAMRDTLKISSPSVVMYQIGQFAGQGLADGLRDATADVGSIITDAMDKAIAQVTTSADRNRAALRGAFGSLFNQFAGSQALIGPGATTAFGLPSAQAGVTQALNSFLSTFDSAVSQVFGLAQHMADLAKGLPNVGPLSQSELDLVGESAFSLNPNDVLGAANLNAFVGALDAISQLGQTLLAQGNDPQSVANVVSDNVENLIAQASALGFSADELGKLVDQLGLGSQGLQAFVAATSAATKALDDAAAAVQAAAEAAEAAAPTVPTEETLNSILSGLANESDEQILAVLKSLLGEDLGGFSQQTLLNYIKSQYGDTTTGPLANLPKVGAAQFNLYLPHGDPYAIALEVVNALALTAPVPGN